MGNSKYIYAVNIKSKTYLVDLIHWKIINKADECSHYDISDVFNTFNKEYNKKILNLTILITNRCNFKCIYCYQNHKFIQLNKDFDKRIKSFFNKNISKFQGVYIEWFGGEPTLEKEMIIDISTHIKQLCKVYNKFYIGSMTTNGYLLTDDLLKKFIDSGILFYQITIDGIEFQHDQNRMLLDGRGTYQNIINNLKQIRDSSINLNKFFLISVRNNYSLDNYEAIKEFVELYNSEFSQNNHFSNFQYPIKNWNNIDGLNTYLNNYNIEKLFENKSSLGTSYFNRSCFVHYKYGFTIDRGLNIYKCHHNLNSNNIIGKINNNGDMVFNVNENVVDVQKTINWKCKQCIFLPYCLVEMCSIAPLFNMEDCKKIVEREIYKQIQNYIQKEEIKCI